MTTIERADDSGARWERTYVRTGYVEPVNDDTVTDVDYLTARLREMLARAERIAHDPDLRSPGAEGIVLRLGIEQLVDELAPWRQAGTDLFGTLRRLCPAVNWERSGGGIHGQASPWAIDDPTAAAVRRLRLQPCTEPDLWSGVIEGYRVTVRASSFPQGTRETVGDAVADFLVAAGPDLPPIAWAPSEVGGHLLGRTLDGTDEPRMAAQWAAALGLTEVADLGDGQREYSGDTPIGPVAITWISDRAAWRAAVAAIVSQYGGTS